jgi:hypothetical protein
MTPHESESFTTGQLKASVLVANVLKVVHFVFAGLVLFGAATISIEFQRIGLTFSSQLASITVRTQ